MSTDYIQSIPAVVVALDSLGNIESMSDDFASWCQVVPKLGENIENILEDDIYLSVKKAITTAINGDYMALTVVHPLGSSQHHRVHVKPTQRGCILISQPQLITDTGSIEQQKLQKLLSITLDTIEQGIAIYDENLRLVTWNARFEVMAIHPPGMIRTGVSLLECYKVIAKGGVFGPGDPEKLARLHIDYIRTKRMKSIEDLYPPSGRIIQVNRYYLSGGGICATFSDVTAQRQFEEKLVYQANHDFLTGCVNRQCVIGEIDKRIERYEQKGGGAFYLLFVDLDRFKFVNDTFGHTLGDSLLKHCAKRIKSQIDEEQGDCVARLGGDEFLLLISNQKANSDIVEYVETFGRYIAQPYVFSNNRIHISASIGVCHYPLDQGSSTQLIAKADIAMYQAKVEGRNSYKFYDEEMGKVMKRRTQVANQLYEDVSNLRGFYLYFQPVIDLSSGEIVSAEALLRWENEILGVVSPAEFIPIAEETGDINLLGEFVIAQACKVLHILKSIDENFKIAINVSPLQVAQGGFAKHLATELEKYGVQAKNLVVEITESGVIDDMSEVSNNLFAIRALGCNLAIDDFGTGYSSLSYVRKYPFTHIKIDRFFVKDLEKNAEHASLVKAIVDMASAFKLKVVAEGIETAGQNAYLKSINCGFAQGNLHSKPLTTEQFLVLITQHQQLAKHNPVANITQLKWIC